MSALPYLPFYTGDWTRDTRCLTLAAKGAWIDILTYLWNSRTPGTLEKSTRRWSRALGCSEEQFERILAELEEDQIADIVRTPDTVAITSRRMLREHPEVHAAAQARSEKARTAAQARWNKSESNTDSDPPPMLGASPSNAIPETRSKTRTKESPPEPPRKSNRSSALTESQLIAAISPDLPHREIATRWAAYKASLPARDGYRAIKSWETALQRMAKYPLEILEDAVERAIANGWKGWEQEHLKRHLITEQAQSQGGDFWNPHPEPNKAS